MPDYYDSNDRHSLTAKVFQRLRDDIIEGKYQTGEYLVESRLAEELGVSRTPVREALKQLELEDLACSIPNRGVVVTGITAQDIDEIYTIRYLLEGQAAYWAAERIDEDKLNKLEENIQLMEFYAGRNDAPRLAQLDTEFHNIIFTASKSRTLKHVLATLHQNLKRARQSSFGSPDRTRKSLAEHQAIVAAIKLRDALEAKKQMELHIKHAKEKYIDQPNK